jgi:hypothetical protein
MELQERIAKACYEIGEVRYRSYSGRGMYGKDCVGITGPNSKCLIVLGHIINENAQEVFDDCIDASDENLNLVYEARDEFQETVERLMSFRMDQMGFDVVFYWPYLPYQEVEGYDEEG